MVGMRMCSKFKQDVVVQSASVSISAGVKWSHGHVVTWPSRAAASWTRRNEAMFDRAW